MSRWLLVGPMLIGAGILALVFGFDRPKVIYSVSVSEFASRGLLDRPVRVRGTLVPGTLCKSDAECEFRFRLADTAASHSHEQLSVSYDGCVLPDTFRDVPGVDLELTVEGERCRTCHDFKASQVMAKCTGKYEYPRDGGPRLAVPAVPRCSALTPKI